MKSNKKINAWYLTGTGTRCCYLILVLFKNFTMDQNDSEDSPSVQGEDGFANALSKILHQNVGNKVRVFVFLVLTFQFIVFCFVRHLFSRNEKLL